jgi:hypothetical protein
MTNGAIQVRQVYEAVEPNATVSAHSTRQGTTVVSATNDAHAATLPSRYSIRETGREK